MTVDLLRAELATLLEALVLPHPDRHVGGPGNAAATDLAERALSAAGFDVESTAFDCLDWLAGPSRLVAGDREWRLLPGPWSLPCDVIAPLAAAATVEDLERDDLEGRVLLLHGDLAREQLLPKSFAWLDLPHHRRIVALLETRRPAAVLAATGRGSGFSGGLSPFPVIDDGDVDLSSAYLRDVEGAQLLARVGAPVRVTIDSRRSPARARQLVAGAGPEGAPRVVALAHIDSKPGSPGAVDNATGVAALLGLARRLSGYAGPYRLELVPVNGEDHYANPGEHLLIERMAGRWEEVVLGVNLDGIGGRGGGTAVSTYGCPTPLESTVRVVMARHPGMEPGEPWYESDHSLVIMNGRPAAALTSANVQDLVTSVTHSARDTLAVVDAGIVADVVRFLEDLVISLPTPPGTKEAR
jgi:aminopeptidase YwaD